MITDQPAAIMRRPGGIDLNPANLAMTIKRDGKGVSLPFNEKDMAQLSGMEGLEPHLLGISPVTSLPIVNEFKQKII